MKIRGSTPDATGYDSSSSRAADVPVRERNKSIKRIELIAIALVFTLLASAGFTDAQGTALTYQRGLNGAGTPARADLNTTSDFANCPAPVTEPGRTQRLNRLDAVPEGLSAPDWSSIRQQYEQHRHTAFRVDGAHQARNPGQQWQIRFDGRGFLSRPDAAGWQWGLELRSYGFPGQERAVGQPRVSASGQRVAYDWDDALQEWFVNDPRGLEHGFTVHQRPPGGDSARSAGFQPAVSPTSSRQVAVETECIETSGAPQAGSPAIQQTRTRSLGYGSPAELTNLTDNRLTFTLAVRGGLRPEVQADGRSVHFVDAHGATVLTYTGLTVLDADGRTLPARFEVVEGSRRREEADSDPQETEPVRLVTSAATEVLRLAVEECDAVTR